MNPSTADRIMSRSDPRHPATKELSSYHIAASSGSLTSYARATICAMNHDTVTALLWSLAGFDPALVHFAELREKFRTMPEDNPSRISLDRLLSVYLEGQYRELLTGAGITSDEANANTEKLIGKDQVLLQVLDCTGDPLAVEIWGYALWLAVLTAHGNAPWHRLAAVVGDCHHQLRATR